MEVDMGLPSPESARTWGGKLLVDRDGTEIGTCTEIFVDDATGLPEWAAADLSGGHAVVPLLDATESGDRVQVAVRQADVVDAPSLGHGGHMSEDDEERLYRHYGIEVSREASESLLPAPDAEVPAAPSSPAPTSSPSTNVEVDAQADADATSAPGTSRGKLLPALGAGLVGGLAVVAAAIFWWRQRRHVPPTRKELLAARAQAASLALSTRGQQLATSAAPLLRTRRQQLATSAAPMLRTGRQVSAATARHLTLQAGAAAERAAAQARVAAEAAAVQARTAAQQAAALTATAKTLRVQRVQPAAEVEVDARVGRRVWRLPFHR
jgi:hypothetical protein